MSGQAFRTMRRGNAVALLSCVLMGGLLAACIATIAPAMALIVAGTGKAYAPAMVMAADGTKHIAWQECPLSGGCAIPYYRTRFGEPLITQTFAPPPGADNINPDIALSDDGMAYIVWTTFYSSTSPSNVDKYAALTADGSLSAISNLDPGAGMIFHFPTDRPRVVALSNTVFAIYSLQPLLFGTGGTF